MIYVSILVILGYMITLIREGEYVLVETKLQIKILTLDNTKQFAWVNIMDIGEILVTSHKVHKVDHILAMGKYRLYKVKDEPDLTDLKHLELSVGKGVWQGYLLPTGLPTVTKKKKRIIPTKEIITRASSLIFPYQIL